eukprot:2570777-Rhodomonas_salina.4
MILPALPPRLPEVPYRELPSEHESFRLIESLNLQSTIPLGHPRYSVGYPPTSALRDALRLYSCAVYGTTSVAYERATRCPVLT